MNKNAESREQQAAALLKADLRGVAVTMRSLRGQGA
jgi:hypothetical protein